MTTPDTTLRDETGEMQTQARICPTCYDDHSARQRCTPAPVSDSRREDERPEAACAWADYRKDYGISSDPLDAAHKAFMAGRQSVLGTLDAGGVQR